MYSSRNLTCALLCLTIAAPQQALFAQPAAATTTTKFALTIDNIMRGPGLVGYEPSAVRWSYDASKLYFQWKQYNDPQDTPMDTYVVNRDGSGLRKLTEEEAKLAPPAFGERSKDKKWTVYADAGDLFIYDNEKGVRRRLTKTSDVESQPHFMGNDSKRITFVRANNLFTMSLEEALIEQLTDIRTGAPGAAPVAPVAGGRGRGAGAQATGDVAKGTDSQEYLKKEERGLLDIISERAKRREEAEAKRKKEESAQAVHAAGASVGGESVFVARWQIRRRIHQ